MSIPHLVARDGYTGMEGVSDHDQVFVSLQLAVFDVAAAPLAGCLNQRLHGLDLLH